MRLWAWIRDWTIVAVGPWVAIYLFWHGPIWAAVALATLVFFAAVSRASQ